MVGSLRGRTLPDRPRCGIGLRSRRATVLRVRTVPLDEGPPDRRRIGPFWIEEGLGLVAFGAAFVALVAALYTLAVINRPR